MQPAAYFSVNRIVELAAVVFSIAYTILITYGNILCWPSAVIASILFIYLVYQRRLLAETVLHVFYLAAAVYGWITWGTSGKFAVSSYGVSTNIILITIGFILVILSGFFLKRFSKALLPYIDSFTTIFSFIATYMMAHMIIENWFYWIIIDSISVFMYAKRGLYLGAGLFVIYTILAINGYFSWHG